MPGYLLHVGATVICAHGGQAQPTLPNPRVKVMGQPVVTQFINRLRRRGVRVCVHRRTQGYPTDVDLIVSDEGYGANEYVETERPISVHHGTGMFEPAGKRC